MYRFLFTPSLIICKIKEAGRVLNEHFSGHFKNVVLQSSRSAQQLILLVLKYFTSYRDEAIFEGKPGYFP